MLGLVPAEFGGIARELRLLRVRKDRDAEQIRVDEKVFAGRDPLPHRWVATETMRRERQRSQEDLMTHSPAWSEVSRADVLRAIKEYDRLGPERFFSKHGFAPTTTYELVWDKRRYPPKAILGTAYELATGQRLASGDFEGGKTGAVKVLGELGFTVRAIRRSPR